MSRGVGQLGREILMATYESERDTVRQHEPTWWLDRGRKAYYYVSGTDIATSDVSTEWYAKHRDLLMAWSLHRTVVFQSGSVPREWSLHVLNEMLDLIPDGDSAHWLWFTISRQRVPMTPVAHLEFEVHSSSLRRSIRNLEARGLMEVELLPSTPGSHPETMHITLTSGGVELALDEAFTRLHSFFDELDEETQEALGEVVLAKGLNHAREFDEALTALRQGSKDAAIAADS